MSSQARLLVHAAFSEAPFPDMTLQEAELRDHTPDREIAKEEWVEARRAGEGITWKHVPLQVILNCSTALSHISEAGFVYFVPAYICASLDQLFNPQTQAGYLVGSTVFHLTHTETNYSLSRLKAFSLAQGQAIIAFLSEVAQHGGYDGKDATIGLETYWLTPKAREPLLYVP